MSEIAIRPLTPSIGAEISGVDLRSPLEPDEVGKASLFLLSDMASGVTGEILHVDCGYNIMGV